MSRPDGEVVAPLPEGWTAGQHEAGRVRGPGWRLMEVDATGDDLVVTAHPDDWEPTAPTSCVVRALHDAGQLDAYLKRCEAAAWRRFDFSDRVTWPGAVEWGLVTSQGSMFVARFDREAEIWESMDAGYRITRRSDVHWRPLPAGPEVEP